MANPLQYVNSLSINGFYFQDIQRCIDTAIEVAGMIGGHKNGAKGGSVKFEFNRVTVHVRGDSDPVVIYSAWKKALNGDGQDVGPYPAA